MLSGNFHAQSPDNYSESQPRAIKTKGKTRNVIIRSAAAMLIASAQVSLAGSATWLSNANGFWNDPNNWTPGGPPNGPFDVATFAFATSSSTGALLVGPTQVDRIVFTGSTQFDIRGGDLGNAYSLTFSGAGIVNNSGHSQTFTIGYVAGSHAYSFYRFNNNATVTGLTYLFLSSPNAVLFNNNSSAGSAIIDTTGDFGHGKIGRASCR